MPEPPTPVVPAGLYSTPARVASDLNINISDSQYSLIISCLTAATGAVTRWCNRSFIPVNQTRRYTADTRFPTLPLGDTISLTSVKLADRPGSTDYDAWIEVPETEYLLMRVGGQVTAPYFELLLTNSATSFTRHLTKNGRELLIPNVETVGRHGWEAVPAQIEEATRLLAARYMTRHNKNISVESEYMYDPDIQALVDQYKWHVASGLPEWQVV